ncbi:SRPBCC domain-containing protein [Rhodococcus sp. NPDC049939]|uniref:SRPBCC domain-containing protein n=1 Tax=Rhodococcus sp. NPDC049939 TaxID=3155511 RepID=UPI0034094B77
MNPGTVSFTYDGRVALRFEQSLAHSPEKVWGVLTDPDFLKAWFPADVEFDLTPGAELVFRVTPEQVRRFGLPADHSTTGTVISVHPAHILEYLWDAETLHWELVPDGTGGCWLTLTHTVEEEESAYAHAAGWHAGLEVIEARLDGRTVDWSLWDRTDELAKSYRKSP